MKTETAALSAPLTDLISLEGKMFLTSSHCFTEMKRRLLQRAILYIPPGINNHVSTWW